MEKDYSKTNLDVTTFRNGDPIYHAQSNLDWKAASDLEEPAYCIHDGRILYNWYAVNDPRGLAPKGWKIPTDEMFSEMDLLEFHKYPQYDGFRYSSGPFSNPGCIGYWWSATAATHSGGAWFRFLYNYGDETYRGSLNRGSGFSVRCLKEEAKENS